jgi:hypothetical protein
MGMALVMAGRTIIVLDMVVAMVLLMVLLLGLMALKGKGMIRMVHILRLTLMDTFRVMVTVTVLFLDRVHTTVIATPGAILVIILVAILVARVAAPTPAKPRSTAIQLPTATTLIKLIRIRLRRHQTRIRLRPLRFRLPSLALNPRLMG